MARRGSVPFSTTIIDQLYPGGVGEHRFHPTRKWRFDWAWVDKKIALEYEGGIFVKGRHTRALGYDKDAEKYNHAALLGWIVLRVTPMMWRDGRALKMLDWAFKQPAGGVAGGA